MIRDEKTDNLVYQHPVDAQIEAYLTAENFKFEFSDEFGCFFFFIKGNHFQWKFIVDFDSERNTVLFRSAYPFVVQDTRKLQIAELLTRLNFMLILGNFHLDFEDGLVLFKIMHLVQDGSLDQATFSQLLYSSIHVTDDHFVPILSVNEGMAEPIVAYMDSFKKY